MPQINLPKGYFRGVKKNLENIENCACCGNCDEIYEDCHTKITIFQNIKINITSVQLTFERKQL